VIAALAATSAGLAFGLAAPELKVPALPLALSAGGITALIIVNEMMTRDRPAKTAVVFAAALVGLMALDIAL
jgi:hypothetical protein